MNSTIFFFTVPDHKKQSSMGFKKNIDINEDSNINIVF